MDNRRAMAGSTLDNLVGNGVQGDRIKQTVENVRNRPCGTTKNSISQGWDKGRFLALLGLSAKEDGTWIDDISTVAYKKHKLKGGYENEVYVTKDGKSAVKLNNLNFLNDDDTQYENTRDIDYFIARLNAQYELFPSCKYEIIGFAENSDIQTCIVLTQPFFEDAELSTISRIFEWLEKGGFISTGMGRYSNGKYILSDIKPQNVLVDKNGDLRFIDLDIEIVKNPHKFDC